MDSVGGEVLIGLGLMAGMLGCIEAGFRWGHRERSRGLEETEVGIQALEAAIFGLVSLLLAFSFSAGQSRLEWRRQQIIEEGNAIGTAYLRLDLLRPEQRGALRASLRDYARLRAAVYLSVGDRPATAARLAQAQAQGQRVWAQAAAACPRSPVQAGCMLVLPAVNAMLDAASARTEAAEARTPAPILLLLLALAPVSGLLAGFAMATRTRRSPAHAFLYTAVTVLTMLVILDLDNPRFGLIRLRREQQRVMAEVLGSMDSGGARERGR
jgi:hypothetical protein